MSLSMCRLNVFAHWILGAAVNGSHMFDLKPTDETFYNLNPLLCNSLMMAGWGGGGLWTNSLDLEHEIQKK